MMPRDRIVFTGNAGKLLREAFAKPKKPHKVSIVFQIDVEDDIWQMLKRQRAQCPCSMPEISFKDWVTVTLTETAKDELGYHLNNYIPDNYS